MIPRVATYRLQLREGMTLDRARELVVPHAHRLGASHLYLSPPFAAAPGSTHGYDVIDHNAVEPDLGGRAALERLAQAARVPLPARAHVGQLAVEPQGRVPRGDHHRRVRFGAQVRRDPFGPGAAERVVVGEDLEVRVSH